MTDPLVIAFPDAQKARGKIAIRNRCERGKWPGRTNFQNASPFWED